MKIRNVRAELWTLPLHAPFAISQRIAYTAENVFIFVDVGAAESIRGFGASAPVAYVTGETVDSVRTALDGVASKLVGVDISDLAPALSIIATELDSAPAARAGLEMAIYDAWAKRNEIALWEHFGGAVDALSTDMTIPITPPEAAGELAARAQSDGFTTLKIKVGACKGPDADLARIRAVVDAAPAVRLRIDANQAFTPGDAIEFAKRLETLGAEIDLIEQPVRAGDIEALKTVREGVGYPVFADEAACSPQNVRELIEKDAVDGVNVKLMKSGITGALQIIDLCRAAGKKLMIGCMLETTLGIAAAAQIAAGTDAFDHIDLDSHHLLAPVSEVTGGIVDKGPTLSIDRRVGSYGWGVKVELRSEK